jgi:hypothetical protein
MTETDVLRAKLEVAENTLRNIANGNYHFDYDLLAISRADAASALRSMNNIRLINLNRCSQCQK